MDKLKIETYESVGNINFGEARASVREKLGLFKEFKKNKFSKNTADDFKFCHAFYDENNNVEAIEFFESVSLILNENNLMNKSFSEIKNEFNDENIEEDSSGAIFHTFGFSVYSPDKEKIESILVFKKGYYD